MDINNNNLSLEDERQLAKDYNYNSSVNPINTTPVTPTYVPGISDIRDIPLPDYELREKTSKTEMPNIVNNIRQLTRGSFSAEASNPDPFMEMLASKPKAALNPYGEKVALSESHEIDNSGNWKPKYPNYQPGINNEDYYARTQGTWDKVWNGVGKLAFKTALYGGSGIVMIPDKLMTIAREGSFKAALNTKFDQFADDLDKSIDRLFPHYYRQEVEDYNLGQKITKDTGNFIWNDVVGSGMSFTFGAMLSAAATGGMGATSLGASGAKLGLRTGAKLAARDATRKGIGSLKSVFNNYLRQGVEKGRTIGGIAQNINFLATSAGFESAFEARSYMKESEQEFKDYYNRMYGRNPNFEELNSFRETNNTVAGGVFAANMGIVGLSNWLLFGKYFGVGGKTIGKGERWLNNKLFGLGTEISKPGEMALKVTDANTIQKVAGTVFNITKRPFSEGVWEEGTQGVVQNAAKEYIESRYNENIISKNVGIFDAIWDGFKKQYTTKEGWNEIGIGAIIGGLFGAREGAFGTREYSNKQIQLNSQVKDYNSKVSNFNSSAINLLKQSISLGPQVGIEAENMTSKDFDESIFAKMSIEHEMGTLDDSSENFRTMMNMVPLEDIAQEHNLSLEEAEQYKNDLISDYDTKLNDFKNSIDFADNLIGDENKTVFKDYIARNAFMGLQADNYLHYLADKIGKLASNDIDISTALNTYSRLSSEARADALILSNLKNRISDIEKRIEDIATRPNRVDENGVDTSAEDIRQETQVLQDIKSQYDELSYKLSTMSNQEFNISDFIYANQEITQTNLNPITAESIVDANDKLKAFDNFINDNNLNAKNQAVKLLIGEYRNRLVDYRNLNNTLSKMMDKRFMRQEERGLMKLFSDIFSKEYKNKNESTDIIETGSLGNLYQSDKAIDEALAEKQITEDEAFSFKALLHSFDSIRDRKDEEAGDNIQETVSDDIYEGIMNSSFMDYDTEQSILNKLFNEKEYLLTPREKEIYNNRKDYFDTKIVDMGDSPIKALLKLRNKVESLLNPTSLVSKNKAIINLAREKLSPEERKEFDNAIDKYNRLKNQQDKGEEIDETELLQAMYSISDLGNVGNITDLIPFIEQNRVIERGVLGITTLPNFGSTDDQLATLSNEIDDTGSSSTNIDSAQNPSVLMGRKVIGRNGEELFEISGLRTDRFIEEIFKYVDKVIEHVVPNGLRRYEVIFKKDGIDYTAKLFETSSHNRFIMSEESANIINQNSNFIIKDVSGINGYFAILKRDDNGNLIPFKSGIGFGENETDKIDENTLSKIKVGDKVQLIVDVNDTYNKSLLNKYLEAINENDKDELDKAKSNLANNLVIKIMKDGKFVSVIRADFGDGTPGLSRLRSKAFDEFTKSTDVSIISLGEVKVAQTLPGKPNYTLSVNEDGDVDILNNNITKQGAKKILNVGFIFNGKVSLKNKGKYSTFPFGTNIIKDAEGKYKDVKIPIAVIEGSNGVNYVYPVGLKSKSEEESNSYINTINELIGPDGQDLIPMSLNDIQDINSYISNLGLSPLEYQIPLTGSIQEIQSALKKAAIAIERESGKPNVDNWIIDNSRDISDIAVNDISININLENDIFIAPKIRLALPGMVNAVVVTEDEISEDNMEDETEEEDLPFPNPKQESTRKTSLVVPPSLPLVTTQPFSEEQDLPTGTDRSFTGNVEVSEPQRSTSKKFSTRIEELPKTYNGFFDFLGRKVASGDLSFLRVRTKDKRTGDDIRRFLSLPLNTDIIKRISSSKGMAISKYIGWLKSSNEDIVKDYLSTRSNEQVMMELKTFLTAIKYNPGNALNYSRRINGMDVLSEYTSEEEINKIESDINNEVTTSLELKDDVVKVVDNTTEAILNISDVESFNELKETLNESSNLTEEEIISVVDQVIEEYTESLPEEKQNVFNEEFIEKWENIKNGRGTNEIIEESSERQPIESSITEISSTSKGQSREIGTVTANAGLSGYEGIIDETVADIAPRVTTTTFLFAGEDAYSSIEGDITEIPNNVLKKNGIKKGVSFVDLTKAGYKRAGGSWIYKFYMNTGLYDLYNIHTGEAFRILPNNGVKINSSNFVNSLNQKGRSISNLVKGLSNEEIGRTNSLINKTNLSQSENEINKPC